MAIKPLHDNIVIRLLDAVEKTAGGILLPDTAKEKPQRGTVLAVGPGRVAKDGKRIPLDVKVGDVVLFGKYSGKEVPSDEELKILGESEVLALFVES